MTTNKVCRLRTDWIPVSITVNHNVCLGEIYIAIPRQLVDTKKTFRRLYLTVLDFSLLQSVTGPSVVSKRSNMWQCRKVKNRQKKNRSFYSIYHLFYIFWPLRPLTGTDQAQNSRHCHWFWHCPGHWCHVCGKSFEIFNNQKLLGGIAIWVHLV